MAAGILRNLGFRSSEPLTSLLRGHIEQVLLLKDHHDYCAEVTLWYREGRGVSISSEMQDVADRLEVGVLSFERVDRQPTGALIAFPKDDTPQALSFEASIPPTQIWKLKITEVGNICESGLRLSSENDEVTIVASGRPCFLSVSVKNLFSTAGGPEYPLSDYEQERVF